MYRPVASLLQHQAWTGHCAVAQAPPFDEHRRPLAPSKFFDVRYGEKFINFYLQKMQICNVYDSMH